MTDFGAYALGSTASEEGAANLSGDTSSEEDDLLDLIERIERENPNIAADWLARETDEILGRKPERLPDRARSAKNGRRKRRRKSSTFDWFAQMVEAKPLLEPERIIEAARAVEIGILAEERLRDPGGTITTRRDAADLYTLIEHGRAEYQLLVVSNLRLVFHWSKGVASTIDEDWAQDAFQAGCIGLMRGLQGWDYAKGYALSTFVSWHIRQTIQRWRANEVLIIRLPVHVWEGLDSAEGDLTPETEAAATRAQNIRSLDEMDPEDEGWTWDGGLGNAANAMDRRRVVKELLDTLTQRESDVLRLRYGLNSDEDEPQTLDRIGDSFGLTRERIRQIEQKSLKKLRGHLEVASDWLYLL